jgi:hypothetical protein
MRARRWRMAARACASLLAGHSSAAMRAREVGPSSASQASTTASAGASGSGLRVSLSICAVPARDRCMEGGGGVMGEIGSIMPLRAWPGQA